MDCGVEMYMAAAFGWILTDMTVHCAQATVISVEPYVSGQPALVLVNGDDPGGRPSILTRRFSMDVGYTEALK
jgi:hypothetical protein